jgi:hypothetical protein
MNDIALIRLYEFIGVGLIKVFSYPFAMEMIKGIQPSELTLPNRSACRAEFGDGS